VAGNTNAESGNTTVFSVLRSALKSLRQRIVRAERFVLQFTGTGKASYHPPPNHQQGSRAAEEEEKRSGSWYRSMISMSVE